MDRGPELRNEMRRTCLVQTLLNPINDKVANVFAFGGGLVNGGFNEKAMNLIQSICTFDYMGAAEFEWGAVPNTFAFIAKQAIAKNLISGSITLNKEDEVAYYICPKPYEEEVKNRIKLLRQDKIQLKCGIGFYRYFDSLKNSDKYFKRRKGWVELDNGFMFFVDKTMFENFKNLFGVE